MTAWVSLKDNEGNVTSINMNTLKSAAGVANLLSAGKDKKATEALIQMAHDLAASENGTFHQKLPLAQWAVSKAKLVISGDLVAMTAEEAEEHQARQAIATLV